LPSQFSGGSNGNFCGHLQHVVARLMGRANWITRTGRVMTKRKGRVRDCRRTKRTIPLHGYPSKFLEVRMGTLAPLQYVIARFMRATQLDHPDKPGDDEREGRAAQASRGRGCDSVENNPALCGRAGADTHQGCNCRSAPARKVSLHA